jgi:hypothetical protein
MVRAAVAGTQVHPDRVLDPPLIVRYGGTYTACARSVECS